MATELQRLSRRLAKLLAEKQRLVVFAESCTAGLVAATLSQVPGISQFLCGSMVVYQNETKSSWLGIEGSVLKRPGSVSEVVARQMAEEVLKKTPQAHLAASVTGHFGPNAPVKLDGVIFIAIYERSQDWEEVQVRRHQLKTSSRTARQNEATRLVLKSVIQTLESAGH